MVYRARIVRRQINLDFQSFYLRDGSAHQVWVLCSVMVMHLFSHSECLQFNLLSSIQDGLTPSVKHIAGCSLEQAA